MLLRGIWAGDYQSLSWEIPAVTLRQGFVFEPTGEQGKAVALTGANAQALDQKRFPAADLFFNRECTAGTPSWLPRQGFPFAIGESSVWTVHLAAGQAVLACYDKRNGQLQQTTDITDDLLNVAERSQGTYLALAALDNGVAVALGNRLVIAHAEGRRTQVELPGQVVRLVATIPNTRQGVAALLRTGAVIYWVGAAECIELDRDLALPIAAFIPGGPLVLASDFRCLLLEVDSRGVHRVTRMELISQRITGVSAAENPGEFALLGEHGQMTLYRFPR
jgi:hypothetical protein